MNNNDERDYAEEEYNLHLLQNPDDLDESDYHTNSHLPANSDESVHKPKIRADRFFLVEHGMIYVMYHVSDIPEMWDDPSNAHMRNIPYMYRATDGTITMVTTSMHYTKDEAYDWANSYIRDSQKLSDIGINPDEQYHSHIYEMSEIPTQAPETYTERGFLTFSPNDAKEHEWHVWIISDTPEEFDESPIPHQKNNLRAKDDTITYVRHLTANTLFGALQTIKDNAEYIAENFAEDTTFTAWDLRTNTPILL